MMDMSSSGMFLIVFTFLLTQVNALPKPHALPRPQTIRMMRSPVGTSAAVPATVRKTISQAAFQPADGLTMVDSFFRDYPYISSFFVTGMKGGFADGVAQAREKNQANEAGKDKTFSLLRNFAFIMYAGAYQGCAQHFIYNELFPLWFSESPEITSVAPKVLFDMFVLTPAVCLPIAYLTKAAIFNGPAMRSFQAGTLRYLYDVRNNGLLTKYWSLWVPVQSINFSLVPPHLRIAFIAVVSFFWVIILSGVMGQTRKRPERQIEEAMSAESSVDNANTQSLVAAMKSDSAKGGVPRRLLQRDHLQESVKGIRNVVSSRVGKRMKKVLMNYTYTERGMELLNQLLVDVAPHLITKTINSASTSIPMIF